MPKGGSGFMRAAGRAASRALGSGSNVALVNRGRSIREIQDVYAHAYRNGMGIRFDRAGNIAEITGPSRAFDRFADQAEAAAKRISGTVTQLDREASARYETLRDAVRNIRTSEAEMREFRATYQGERHTKLKVGKEYDDASNTARSMIQRGLVSESEVFRNGANNVDVLAALHDAVNAAKAARYGPIGESDRQAFEADLFDSITSGYGGVYRGAMRRRKK